MTSVHNTYLEGKVLSAEPLTLIAILYSTAAQNVQIALDSLDSNDPVLRGRAVAKASEALGMLASALDMDKGGEVGENLLGLYLYMQRRLTESLAACSRPGFEEVHRLLITLQPAWAELASGSHSPTQPQPIAHSS